MRKLFVVVALVGLGACDDGGAGGGDGGGGPGATRAGATCSQGCYRSATCDPDRFAEINPEGMEGCVASCARNLDASPCELVRYETCSECVRRMHLACDADPFQPPCDVACTRDCAVPECAEETGCP